MKLRVVDNEEVMEKIEAVKNFNCMKGKNAWKEIPSALGTDIVSVS